MRLAGINPLLAGQHEASSPAGAAATMQNTMGQGITSAMQALQLRKTIEKQNAEIKGIKANTRFTTLKGDVLEPSGTVMREVNDEISALFGGNDKATLVGNSRRWLTDQFESASQKVGPHSITGGWLGRQRVQDAQAGNSKGGTQITKGNTKIVETARGSGVYQIYKKIKGKWVAQGAPKDKSYFNRTK